MHRAGAREARSVHQHLAGEATPLWIHYQPSGSADPEKPEFAKLLEQHRSSELRQRPPAGRAASRRPYAIAKGLQDKADARVLKLVTPLFCDRSFYVRRAAAMTAISQRDKAGIPVLLETLRYHTLDMTENYGDNLFHQLAHYLGVDFGLDAGAWTAWWKKARKSFAFPSASLIGS